MMAKSTRAKSDEQERRIAKALGGRQVIGSGSTPFLKGDVVSGKLFIEAKTKMVPCDSISVKRAWLEKAKAQALATGKSDYAVAVSFGDNKDFYIVEDDMFKDLYTCREALRALIDVLGGLDDPLVDDLDNLKASGIRALVRRYLGE